MGRMVSTWLKGVGLNEQIISNFEKQGIHTAQQLAALELDDYDALFRGTTSSGRNDRQKLFYLVQRIRIAVNGQQDHQDDNIIEDDPKLDISRTLSHCSEQEQEEQEEKEDVYHEDNITTTTMTAKKQRGIDTTHHSPVKEIIRHMEEQSAREEEMHSSVANNLEDIATTTTTKTSAGDMDVDENTTTEDDGNSMSRISTSLNRRRSARLQSRRASSATSSSSSPASSSSTCSALAAVLTRRKSTSDASTRTESNFTTPGVSSEEYGEEKATVTSHDDEDDSASTLTSRKLRPRGSLQRPSKWQNPTTCASSNNTTNVNANSNASVSSLSSYSTRSRSKRLSTIPSGSVAPMSPLDNAKFRSATRSGLQSSGSNSCKMDEPISDTNTSTNTSTRTSTSSSNGRRRDLGSESINQQRTAGITVKSSSRSSARSRSTGRASSAVSSTSSFDNDSSDGAITSRRNTRRSSFSNSRSSGSNLSAKSLDETELRRSSRRKSSSSAPPAATTASGSSSASATKKKSGRLSLSSNRRASYSNSRSATSAISCKSLDEVEIRRSLRKSGISSFDHNGQRAMASPRSSPPPVRTSSRRNTSFSLPQRTRPTSSRSTRRSLSAPSPLRHNSRNSVSSPSSLGRSGLSQSTHPSSDSSSLPVLVHGKTKDDSWLELVDQLRAENADDYEDMSEKENFEDYMEEEDMRIRVVIRKRPLSSNEMSKSDVDVIQPVRRTMRVLVYQPRVRVDLTREVDTQKFAFDNVFGEYAGNSRIYEETIKELVPNVFDGNWSSVFAYGQTGSGKTFTMMGSNLTGSKAGVKKTAGYCENFGLYYLAARDVFQYRQRQEYADIDIGVSLFEIYGGKLFDLLNNRSPVKCLEDRKGKVCFPGLTEHPVGSAEDLLSMIEEGALNRSVGTTSANADSSRSHAVLQLSLRKAIVMRRKTVNIEHGRLTFIDLAGSERGVDTNKASRTTRLEGAEINTSLLALKEVIRALAVGDSAQHIPFRGSKLTQVLKESFVGENCKAVMIACVAPNLSNCEHTLNTLRYADRVKERNPESRKPKAFLQSKNRRRSVNNSTPSAVNRPSTAPSKPHHSVETGHRSSLSSASGISLSPTKHIKNEVAYNEAGTRTSSSTNMMKQNAPKMAFCTPPEASPEKEGWDPRDSIVLDDFFSSPSQEEIRITVEEDSSRDIGEIMEDGKVIVSTISSNSSLDIVNKQQEAKCEVMLKDAENKLLSSHREIMSNMLSMMKYEMSLVHSTDENREQIMNYVAELDTMQEKKLGMIEKLRVALSTYNTLRTGIIRDTGDKQKNDFLIDNCSDADFEDLRDSLGV